MKFKYFGTAAAECFPALFCSCEHCQRAIKAGGKNIRTRSQALVNDDLLIDLPPDTYYHMINNGLELTKVKYIIFTHSHEDHFYLYDLHRTYPPFAYDANKQKIPQINIYGNESINRYAGDFENVKDILSFHEIHAFEKFTVGEYTVTPLKADHDQSQNCLIFIIEDKFGKKILYGNDTGYFPDETWDYLQKNHTKGNKFNFISLDATSGIEECRRGHMGIACCAEVRERLIGMGTVDENAVFCYNHFSHNGAKIYDELVPIAKGMGFLVSYDGMEINV
ncbi:MAG: MBL fold metallo-hydrolase [Oscillospiraceae bacterium]|nr:MBL fold metallo-hydrolase [Oscillospiraceae bacterium]